MNSLASRCAAVAGVQLSELAPGYPLLVLQHKTLTAGVSLYGGQVLSCQHGDDPWLWRNPALQVRPGKALRAGVPVCWPWFGNIGNGNVGNTLPAHGFVRTRLWAVESLQHDDAALTLILGIQDDTETRALWPHRFHLQLQIRLTDVLSVQLRMHNSDSHAYSVAGALHSYFSISDIASASVAGLDGCSYYDQLNGQTQHQTGAITFAAETDRIYHLGASQLTLSATPGQLQLQQHGNTDTVVWTPWTDKAARLGDVVGSDWRQFVCVETAIANEHAIILAPDAHHVMGFTLGRTMPNTTLLSQSEPNGRT